MSENQAAVRSSITSVHIVIDTDRVRAAHPNPSKDQNHPTSIAHNFEFMTVSGTHKAAKGEGTAGLIFTAIPGDTIQFSLTSEYNNLKNPVMVYGIVRGGNSTDVFSGPFLPIKSVVKTPYPASLGGAVLPARFESKDFWFYQATVGRTGNEFYWVQFAMYERVEGHEPALVGYFQWDPWIVVE